LTPDEVSQLHALANLSLRGKCNTYQTLTNSLGVWVGPTTCLELFGPARDVATIPLSYISYSSHYIDWAIRAPVFKSFKFQNLTRRLGKLFELFRGIIQSLQQKSGDYVKLKTSPLSLIPVWFLAYC